MNKITISNMLFIYCISLYFKSLPVTITCKLPKCCDAYE